MTTLTAASPTAGGMLAGVRPRPRPASPGGGFTGFEFLRIIRRRILMILLIWLVVTGASIGFTWYMIREYPTYSANAVVKVESIYPVDPLDPLGRDQASKQELDRAVRNQAQVARSSLVLEAVLKDETILRTEWYRWATERARKKDELIVDILLDTISAAPVRDTSYMQISANWRIPKEVALIVNSVLDRYMTQTEELQKAQLRPAQESLDKAVNGARIDFDQAEKEIQDFRAQHQLIGRGDEPNEALMTLQALEVELDMDVRGKLVQYENLSEELPERLPITPDMEAALSYDRRVQNALQRMEEIESGIESLMTKYGPNHRIVKGALKQYELAKQKYQDERAEKLLQIKNEQIQQTRRNYLEANQMLFEVREALNAAAAEQRDRDANMVTLNRLLERRDDARLRLQQIQQQYDYISMTLSSKKVSQVQEVQRATEPKRRASPTYMSWVPIGSILGLALSVGLAVLLELADKTVRIPADVSRSAALPVLATIPSSDDDEIEIERVETACADAPHSIITEAFRQLRANLFFSAPLEQQGVILVTSPSGANGKTTVATNLAISMALSGRRVLLVDANFRRPAVARFFPEVKADGLSNLLIGQARLPELSCSTSIPGLDVLSAGPTPPNPAELLGSSYLRDMVVDARARYDQVIFDGPPILLVSDAGVLASAVDGVLIVCQYRVTSRGALARARAQLETINSRIFGAVLNKVETRAGGYYRRQYREFYEYQQPEEEETSTPRLPKSSGGEPGDAAGGAGPGPGVRPGGGGGSSESASSGAGLAAEAAVGAGMGTAAAAGAFDAATRAYRAEPGAEESESPLRGFAEPEARRPREFEPEPEDDVAARSYDAEPEPADELGDIRIDDSLGLGADEDAGLRDSAGTRAVPSDDPLESDDEFKLDTDFDLGPGGLGLDEEFRLGDDEPEGGPGSGGKPKA